MNAARRAQRLNAAIIDLRLALRNPATPDERRAVLRDELDALRLVRVGVHRPGQTSYLRRLGLAPPRR